MKNLVVQKFGGSSVASPLRIKAIARQIVNLRDQGKKVIVVVSAMGKTTDDLLNLAHEISPRPHRRELDMLLSSGERVSMSLLALALNDLGCSAISFTGSQAGIMTDEAFSNARIIELKPIRVEEALQTYQIVCLAGFQGVNPRTKEITTLGRGGSDTTAVAMAAHFGAERCEILKDVDGVFAGDPKVLSGCHFHTEIPCDVLYEMCFWGAKVLNPRSVEWALKYKVPLFLGRSDNFKIGTRVIYENALVASKSSECQVMGLNSHNQVVELALAAADPNEGLTTLQNLGVDQILRSDLKDGTFTAFVPADAAQLAQLKIDVSQSSKVRIVREDWATVAVTFSSERFQFEFSKLGATSPMMPALEWRHRLSQIALVPRDSVEHWLRAAQAAQLELA